MSDNTSRDGSIRGFGLQCLWSNCFPQLYESLRTPCTLTPFADFRELIDHIWKYHSALLSCDRCDHRFTGARRREKERSALNALKEEHINKCHPENDEGAPTSVGHEIKTMTPEQDEILREWKGRNVKDPREVVSNYEWLCRSLLGDGVEVPSHRYHYLIHEHIVNPNSHELGLRNLEYAKQSNAATQLARFHQQLYPAPGRSQFPNPQHHINPLYLDDTLQPDNWKLVDHEPSQDSGYASRDPRGPPLQMNTSAYMGPTWDFEDLASTGAYFQEALDQRPPSIDLELNYNSEAA
ncbi:hypothetical protein F5B17DRAFT_172844 [Nemania serpens]|nr:hypothetical protein F5B17DRAFT_172844 [Nemania serpens]